MRARERGRKGCRESKREGGGSGRARLRMEGE